MTRCDFFLYFPGANTVLNGTSGLFSIYLERNVFVGQPIALADGLAQLWTMQNPSVSPGVLQIQLLSQTHFICLGGFVDEKELN